MGVGPLVPVTGYGKSIGLAPLPLSYFLWLAGLLITYCVFTQFVKI